MRNLSDLEALGIMIAIPTIVVLVLVLLFVLKFAIFGV